MRFVGSAGKGHDTVKRPTTTLENFLLGWRRWRESWLKGAGRKRTGGVAEGSEDRFRSLVQDASGILLITNADGIVSYVSPAIEPVLGYKPEEVVGKDTSTLVHPDDARRVRDVMAEAMGNPGTSPSMELRLGHRDGSWRHVESSCTSLLDDQAVGGLVFDSREITGRKRAEVKPQDSEARFRSFVEQAADALFVYDLEGRFVEVNRQARESLGYTREELLTLSVADVEENPGAFAGLRERTLSDGSVTLDGVHRRKDGITFPVEVRVGPLTEGGRRLMLALARDVTERRRTESKLREAEAKYRTLVEQIPAITYIGALYREEVKHEILYVSPQVEELLGYSREELTSNPNLWEELVHPEDRDRVIAEDARTERTGTLFSAEYRVIARDGRTVYIRDDARLVRDASGQPRFWQGVMYDITDQKEAEARLRKAEEKYRAVVEQIPAVIYIKEAANSNALTYVSPQMETMLGYELEEWTSDPECWVKTLHPADRKRVLTENRHARETGEPFTMEYRRFAEDGRVVWIRDEATLVRDGRGEPWYWLGVQVDVTERKRAEEALEESELRLRAVITNVPVVLFALDYAGVFKLSEGEGLDALGLKPGEAVGRSVSEIHGDEPEILEDVDRALAGEEFRAVRGIGSRRFEIWYSPLRTSGEEVIGVIGVAVDVTDRERAEEALRQSEERFRKLSDAAFEGIVIHDAGRVLEANEAYAAMHGYELSEILGRSTLEWVAPEYRDLVRRNILSGYEESYESVEVRKDGTRIDVEVRGRELSYRGRTVSVTAVRDVTKRKEAEARLREAEEKYRLLVEQIPAVTYIDRPDGSDEPVYTSPQIEKMLGYTSEEWIENHLWPTRLHPEDRERILAADERFEAGGEAFDEEYRLIHRDGSVVWVHEGAVLLTDEAGEPLYRQGFLTDITERKRVEEVRARLARQAELRADVSAALSESEALQETLQRCTEAIVEKLGAAFARIWLFNQEENMLELQASAGMYTHLDGPHGRVPLGEFKIGLIAKERRPHLADDVVNDPHISDKEWARREGMVAFAGYPLLVEGRLVGVLALFARERLAEDTNEALAQVADVIAQGIERKRAEEALRRSEKSLAEAQWIAHIGNWEYEVEEDRAHWSDEMYRIFDLSPEEFTPTYKAFLGLVHPNDKELVRRAVREALYDGGRSGIEYRIVRLNGEVRYVHSEYELLRGEAGRPRRLIGTVHDTTERKQAEERLREANRRLAELAVLKADFTAMVAHELDTPLAVIRGYVDMLATGELEPAEQSQALDKIQSEADLLEALISDVRTAAFVERETFTLDPQPVRAGTLLKDAAAFVETLPGDHPLVVENDSGEQELWADPYRIGQVLRNLLSNAAKYSPDGAPIELRAVSGQKPQRVRIEVEDRGAGINPEDAGRIFEKFGRGRDRSGRKVPGVGLGLYLSRRLLQAHGSELTMDPAPEGGSVFGFELEIIR
ncbi:MAG: PAS domain S-box protein [Actinomycetota bacterium]|nr:PAS domain S-box protein [Actinomycetota bacterium]